MFKVTAPGKIILTGEHAVVYGYPALVTAIDKRLEVIVKKNKKGFIIDPYRAKNYVKFALKKVSTMLQINPKYNYSIKISSDIPSGCGMGSSAAFAVALSAAIIKLEKIAKSSEKINKIAYEIEKIQHGNPSGVDNTISTYGGYLWYRKESENFKIFSPVKVQKRINNLFILNTGRPRENTGKMVAKVQQLYIRRQKSVEGIFGEIEVIARLFLRYLTSEKIFEIGDLIMRNEKLLEKLGVVSDSTMSLVRKIEKIGGAAKISGAGGNSSASGILLLYHKDPSSLEFFAKKSGLEIKKVKLGERGIKFEKTS